MLLSIDDSQIISRIVLFPMLRVIYPHSIKIATKCKITSNFPHRRTCSQFPLAPRLHSSSVVSSGAFPLRLHRMPVQNCIGAARSRAGCTPPARPRPAPPRDTSFHTCFDVRCPLATMQNYVLVLLENKCGGYIRWFKCFNLMRNLKACLIRIG